MSGVGQTASCFLHGDYDWSIGHCPMCALFGELVDEIQRQDKKHGRYEGTDLGRSRLALATLEDEIAEALLAWREERGAPTWDKTRAEVIQVAAVAMRALRDAL